MAKSKKMATLGLVMILIGGLIGVVGAFIYNYHKDKSGGDKHNELIKGQQQLENIIDSGKKDIIDKIGKVAYLKDSTKEVDENTKLKDVRKITQQKKDTSMPQTTNQIINNAPNQGVQVNENNGTINVNMPLNRTFTISDAKSILKDLPKDFPISVDLFGVDKESNSFYNQVLYSFKSLGYTNVVTDNIVQMALGLGSTPDKGFNYFVKDGKFKFVIYKLER